MCSKDFIKLLLSTVMKMYKQQCMLGSQVDNKGTLFTDCCLSYDSLTIKALIKYNKAV